jgi:hypothetical protein
MPKAYAMLVPTSDPGCIANGVEKQDVQVFADANCTKPMARFMWYNSAKPNSRHSTVKVNGNYYELFWA